MTDPVYAEAFLDWCYNAPLGKRLTRALLSRRLVSAVYGWYCRQPWTRRRIPRFARAMGIDLGELTQPLDSFRSFAEFFARPINLARRPIDVEPSSCVAPADGRLLAYPSVPSEGLVPVKGGLLDRASLLADAVLARRFAGGAIVVVRLYLADYHHFHFPAAGVPRDPRGVSGRYYAVSPYARGWKVPFCGENHRVVTRLDADRFGTIAMVEVGAFTVGSVHQDFVPGLRVEKGAHKGRFELGGSLVVLLFEPGAIRLDDDLCANTRDGVETRVRMGERIGCAAVSSAPV
jgi:phosphatidylserine decarboxylase